MKKEEIKNKFASNSILIYDTEDNGLKVILIHILFISLLIFSVSSLLFLDFYFSILIFVSILFFHWGISDNIKDFYLFENGILVFKNKYQFYNSNIQIIDLKNIDSIIYYKLQVNSNDIDHINFFQNNDCKNKVFISVLESSSEKFINYFKIYNVKFTIKTSY